jgi:hypothetical protein
MVSEAYAKQLIDKKVDDWELFTEPLNTIYGSMIQAKKEYLYESDALFVTCMISVNKNIDLHISSSC